VDVTIVCDNDDGGGGLVAAVELLGGVGLLDSELSLIFWVEMEGEIENSVKKIIKKKEDEVWEI
jgi:hypothetical protein